VKRALFALVWVLAAAAAALPGCKEEASARPQWVIEVGTDAPVPLVGDHVLIELLDAAGVLACPSCRRDAPAAREQDWMPLSFGVLATSNAVYLRTRLYRGDHIDQESGQPDPALTIDNLVKLPDAGGQVMTVHVGLLLDCLGLSATLPSDAASTMQTCSGPARTMVEPPIASQQTLGLRPGTSKLLGVVDHKCTGGGTELMACIPGGVFFLGSSLAPAPHGDVNAAPIPERLVGVNAFMIDRVEVNLQQFSAWMIKNGYTCDDTGARCKQAGSSQAYCVIPPPGSTDPVNELMPVNCVAWSWANAFCEDNGKRLPTEVEWEYVASNGSQDTRFAWGDDKPTCQMAILARDFESKPGQGDETIACLEDPPVPGPQALGKAVLDSRDHTIVFGGFEGNRVFDLAGNVAEWMADVFEPYGESSACWKSTGEVIMVPKVCGDPLSKKDRTVRGGSWMESLQAAWSANRSHVYPTQLLNATPDVGFRCACDLDKTSATPQCAKKPATP
jgi:formylglycine-generating enzyme required for sulfatase activity